MALAVARVQRVTCDLTDEQQPLQTMAHDVSDRERGCCASHCPTEPDAGADAASLETSAGLGGDARVLDGGKASISGGGRRDLYLVMACTGGDGTSGISACAW